MATGIASTCLILAGLAGASTTSASTAQATWWGWGINDYGQLGLGTTTNHAEPTAGSGLQFTQLSAGLLHACGLTQEGNAYCWGRNTFGQLGTGNTTNYSSPQPVLGGHVFSSISVGSSHSCALTSAGDLYCWGINDDGELGLGDSTNRSSPAQVSGTFAQVSAGGHNTCALNSSGAAFCWGDAFYGQIGNGTSTITDVLTPTAVTMPAGATFTSLSSGYVFQCALTGAGALYCWGDNATGQLGANAPTDQTVPTRVAPTISWRAVSAGTTHACALTSSSDTYCWGGNFYGQLGVGDNTARTTPTQLIGQSYESIAAYEVHTCALSSDGQASCWGRNSQGQLGRGTTSTRETSPGAVSGSQRFQSLMTGQQARDFSLAVSANSTSGTSSSGATIYEFTLNAGENARCATSQIFAERGRWVDLPAASTCTRDVDGIEAILLGWATIPDFPREYAERQVLMDYGAYETFDAEGNLTGVFIPAGKPTLSTGTLTLYAIWSD